MNETKVTGDSGTNIPRAADTDDAAMQAVENAFALCRQPGATVQIIETACDAFAAFFGSFDALRLARNAAVRRYDAQRAKWTAQGLPPLQSSRSDILPDVCVTEGTLSGTLERDTITAGEMMRALNREILRRQAAGQAREN